MIRRTASSLTVNFHAKAGGIDSFGEMATTGDREPTRMKEVSLASAMRVRPFKLRARHFQSDLP